MKKVFMFLAGVLSLAAVASIAVISLSCDKFVDTTDDDDDDYNDDDCIYVNCD